MAASLTVNVDQLNQLIATFDDKTEGMDARTGLVVRKAAFDMERGAKARAPVDTGYLKNSIYTEIVKNDRRVYAAEVVVGAEYGVFVEEGTSRMAPQPFMGPAFDAVLPGFLAALEAIANPLETR